MPKYLLHHLDIDPHARHVDPVAPNLFARDFSTQAPHTRWVTDITGVWTAEG